jgi:hypothetical protein
VNFAPFFFCKKSIRSPCPSFSVESIAALPGKTFAHPLPSFALRLFAAFCGCAPHAAIRKSEGSSSVVTAFFHILRPAQKSQAGFLSLLFCAKSRFITPAA